MHVTCSATIKDIWMVIKDAFNMRFQTPQLAQHYKEMIIYILKSDELKLNIRKAIYDEKGE